MNRHLDEETLNALVAGLDVGDEAREHLQDCVFCRRRVDQVREPIESRRREIEAEAPDWDEHRGRIMADVLAATGQRLQPPARLWMRSALALAACVVIAVTVGIFTQENPVVMQDEIPIEQILAEVDDLLASDDLPGFEALAEMVPNTEELAALVEGTSEDREG
jgi:predicted anti-sigma-YlaC factor YlaD